MTEHEHKNGCAEYQKQILFSKWGMVPFSRCKLDCWVSGKEVNKKPA
jgi:hypothetical protein